MTVGANETKRFQSNSPIGRIDLFYLATVETPKVAIELFCNRRSAESRYEDWQDTEHIQNAEFQTVLAQLHHRLCRFVGKLRRATIAGEEIAKFVRRAKSDAKLPHTFAMTDYVVSDSRLPIGVFDSGIGGLTVLEAVLGLDAFNNDTLQPKSDGRLDFEGEKFIYLGDQANMPYGNYPSSGKEDYLRELILKDTVFLLGRRFWPSVNAERPSFDKPPVKAVVIACNTATAYGLVDIRNAMSAWKINLPVIGVVEAGARGVGEQIRNANEKRSVGVLATLGTCSSQAYPKAITSTIGLAGKRTPNIVQQGCLKLAGAIENRTERDRQLHSR